MKNRRMRVITELPRWSKSNNKGKVNWKDTVGMTIEVEHEDYGNVSFKVVDYYVKNKKSHIILDYNGYVLKNGIVPCDFMNGAIGSVMNITNSSKNTFYLDDNNILHIYGENKQQEKWEALYSGSHVNEVMNSTWCVKNKNIKTGNYNFQKKSISLHHVDMKPKSHMAIDHISNEFNLIDKFYDCRIENLREVTYAENNKNIKCKNEWGYTGLKKQGKGWLSNFKYNGINIHTRTKHILNECVIDNLITQRYLDYKHQEEEFYKLDELSEERIKEVTDLLDEKMKKVDGKVHEMKEYEYDIEQKDNYYILKKNGCEMLFDCDLEFIKNIYICPLIESSGVYWKILGVKNNKQYQNLIHRAILGFEPMEYLEYKIHIDHLNNNPSDNRFENLAIATVYSNQCNIKGVGYSIKTFGGYAVSYMKDYKFWNLIGGTKRPTFKTELEAVREVNRRKSIIDNARVKLKSKQELDELIQYCLDNNYIKENNLADLDLGYLYWKGILSGEMQLVTN